jgi:hypothetical protein
MGETRQMVKYQFKKENKKEKLKKKPQLDSFPAEIQPSHI